MSVCEPIIQSELAATQKPCKAAVYVVHSSAVSDCLFHRISHSLVRAMDPSSSDASSFTIAISGGSLPSFLAELPRYFSLANIDPQFHKWHIILADERLVPYDHRDSNLRLLRENLLDQIPMILPDHIHSIDYMLLSKYLDQSSDESVTIHDIANDYQARCLLPLWNARTQQPQKQQQQQQQQKQQIHYPVLLDCVLLGFGPDGHTCSLFQGHKLLQEEHQWVSALNDSPKLPLQRVTLTLPVLNHMSRDVIFLGVGASKRHIVQEIFQYMEHVDLHQEATTGETTKAWKEFVGVLGDLKITSYPCAMVRPQGMHCSLSWILDEDAAGL